MSSKKRANNEGSIFQRKNGQWYAQVAYRGLDGRRKYRTRKAESQRHARVLLTELLNSQPVITPALGHLTVAMFLASWLSNEVKTTRERATYDNYETMARKWISPMLGGHLLTQLHSLHIAEWVHAMEQQGVGRPTMRRSYATLCAALNYAVRLNLVATNPCQAVSRPKISQEEVTPFTEAEVTKIYEDRQHDRLFALYVLGFTTGMRQGEMFAVRISDIDFTDSIIRIGKSSSEAGGQHIKETKTRSGRRVVSMTPFLADALRSRIAIALKEGTVGTGMLFASERGTVIRQSNFRKRHWKPLLQRLEIPHRGFHHVRHTAATEMLRRGVQIKVVSAILGHANIETTLKIYSHWIPDDLTVAAKSMSTFGILTAQ